MKNMKNNNHCPPADELLSVLIDNEGSPNDVRYMQEHIQKCGTCSDLLHDYKQTGGLVQSYRPEPVHLSPSFTNEVMDAVTGGGYGDILDDILGISKKVVAACTIFVVFLLALMMFPADGSLDEYTVEGFTIENGAESEVLGKEEITYEDVVSLVLSQR